MASTSDDFIESHSKPNGIQHDEEPRQLPDRERDKGDYPEFSKFRISDRSNSNAWSSSFISRSHSTTPRSQQSSPNSSPRRRDTVFGSSSRRFTSFGRSQSSQSIFSLLLRWRLQLRTKKKAGRIWHRKGIKGLVLVIGLLALFVLFNWWMLSRLQDTGLVLKEKLFDRNSSSVQGHLRKLDKRKPLWKGIYGRMLALAAHALAELGVDFC